MGSRDVKKKVKFFASNACDGFRYDSILPGVQGSRLISPSYHNLRYFNTVNREMDGWIDYKLFDLCLK